MAYRIINGYTTSATGVLFGFYNIRSNTLGADANNLNYYQRASNIINSASIGLSLYDSTLTAATVSVGEAAGFATTYAGTSNVLGRIGLGTAAALDAAGIAYGIYNNNSQQIFSSSLSAGLGVVGALAFGYGTFGLGSAFGYTLGSGIGSVIGNNIILSAPSINPNNVFSNPLAPITVNNGSIDMSIGEISYSISNDISANPFSFSSSIVASEIFSGGPQGIGLPPEKWSSLRYGFEPCGGCFHGTEEAYG